VPLDKKSSEATLSTQPLVASQLHLVVLLLLLFGTAAAGFLAQHHAVTVSSDSVSAPTLADHSKIIHIYLVGLVMDWGLFYYCFVGIHHKGGTIASISGGRWNSATDVFKDVAIAAPFWVIWEGVAYGVHFILDAIHPSGNAATVNSLLPKSLGEVLLWILLCLTAGFCEEFAFRGYLQKQFHAMTGSITAAVILQGLVFGITHGYQGWKNVVVISALGILYGILAAWRGNLRVNMLSHAWSDAWEGWLKFLIFR
jgi:membrane protease YdiL (CAAX protease family)